MMVDDDDEDDSLADGPLYYRAQCHLLAHDFVAWTHIFHIIVGEEQQQRGWGLTPRLLESVVYI